MIDRNKAMIKRKGRGGFNQESPMPLDISKEVWKVFQNKFLVTRLLRLLQRIQGVFSLMLGRKAPWKVSLTNKMSTWLINWVKTLTQGIKTVLHLKPVWFTKGRAQLLTRAKDNFLTPLESKDTVRLVEDLWLPSRVLKDFWKTSNKSWNKIQMWTLISQIWMVYLHRKQLSQLPSKVWLSQLPT